MFVIYCEDYLHFAYNFKAKFQNEEVFDIFKQETTYWHV